MKGLLAQEGIRAYGTLTAITEALTGRSSPDTYSQPAFLVTSLVLPSYTVTSLDSVPSDSDPGESDVEPLETLEIRVQCSTSRPCPSWSLCSNAPSHR